MNKKAKNLHLENTHFDNPVGVDSPGQYSTAHDLSLLTTEALKNESTETVVAPSEVETEPAAEGQKKKSKKKLA